MTDRIYTAFYMQRYQAKLRGILFLFEFDEWVKWWQDHLGLNWVEKRGRKKGQYVMARFKDKGPYVYWNVHCITNTQNTKDIRNRKSALGEKCGASKLNSQQVMQIYRLAHAGVPLRTVGRQFGINCVSVLYIRDGAHWSHVTKHKKTLRLKY